MKARNIVGTLVVATGLLLGGCASGPITLNYAPSSTMSVDGNVKVSNFEYLPAKSGEIQPNQIRNTAIGEIIFEKNIDEYLEAALFTEFRFVGIDVSKTDAVLTGEIKEFLIDDLGFNVDWTFEVNYVLTKNATACYKSTKLIQRRTNKFGNVFGALNETIKLNIEELMKDKKFVTCIT